MGKMIPAFILGTVLALAGMGASLAVILLLATIMGQVPYVVLFAGICIPALAISAGVKASYKYDDREGLHALIFALYGGILVAFLAYFLEASLEYIWFVSLLENPPDFWTLIWTPGELQAKALKGIELTEGAEDGTWSFTWVAGIGFVVGALATFGGITDPDSD